MLIQILQQELQNLKTILRKALELGEQGKTLDLERRPFWVLNHLVTL